MSSYWLSDKRCFQQEKRLIVRECTPNNANIFKEINLSFVLTDVFNPLQTAIAMICDYVTHCSLSVLTTKASSRFTTNSEANVFRINACMKFNTTLYCVIQNALLHRHRKKLRWRDILKLICNGSHTSVWLKIRSY